MRDSSRRMTRFACSLYLAAIVTGCGGGSDNNGGGNGSPPPSPPPSGTSVTGTAAKGLLGNAVVNFYAINAAGVVSTTPLATTRTNALGVYTSTVTSTGPVVVTVTSDAQSTMLDEVTGTTLPAPPNLRLRAVVAGLTTTPMSVTPLTEMAYNIASAASGGLTVANIDAANSAVSAALLDGASVLTTLPIDLANYKTATVAQQAQAKLLTALTVAAREGFATGPTGAPCSDADYSARIVCMVGGLPPLLTSGASNSLTFAAQSAYLVTAYDRIDRGLVTVAGGKSPGEVGLDTETTAQRAFVTAVVNKAVLFGYNASASPLANTKALFADLRTNIVQAQQGTDIFGVTPIVAEMQADFSANIAPVLAGTRDVLVAAYTAAALIEAAQAGSYEWTTGNIVCGYDPGPLKTAANVALCRYGESWKKQLLLSATRSADGTYAITTQPLTFTAQPSGPLPPYDEIYSPGYGVYAPSETIASVAATFTFNKAANGALSSTWRGPLYVTHAGGKVDGDLSAAQSDDWNAQTITGTLRVSGKLSSGAGGISLTEATIANNSTLVVQNGAQAAGPAPALYGSLNLSRLATSKFAYSLLASISEPVFDMAQKLGVPRSVAVTGTAGQLAADGSITPIFNGRIELGTQGIASFDSTQPLSATNSFIAQLQVIGNLALPNSRVLAVSVGANASQVDPTPAAPHSLSATYAYTTPSGVARINMSGQYDSTNGYSVTITTNAGVTAVVSRRPGGNVEGTVTANGVPTATISGTTINYSDGTTESVY